MRVVGLGFAAAAGLALLSAPHATAAPVDDATQAINALAEQISSGSADRGFNSTGLGTKEGSVEAVGAGFKQEYSGGTIFWSEPTGARALYGAVLAKYNEEGGPTGSLLFPTTSETNGPFQPASRMATFAQVDKPKIYWTPENGAWVVRGPFAAASDKLGTTLGAPLGDLTGSGDVETQKFTNGSISFNKVTGQWTSEPADLAAGLSGLAIPGMPGINASAPNVSAPNMPNMSAPNMPNMSANMSAPNMPDMSAPNVDVNAPSVDASADTGKFNWWWLLLPLLLLALLGLLLWWLFKRRRGDVDLHGPNLSGPGVKGPNVRGPNVDVKGANLHAPDVNAPNVSGGGLDLKGKAAGAAAAGAAGIGAAGYAAKKAFDKPDVDIDAPDLKKPDVNIDGPDLKKPHLDVNAPDVDVNGPDIDVSGSRSGLAGGLAAGAAGIGAAGAAAAGAVGRATGDGVGRYKLKGVDTAVPVGAHLPLADPKQAPEGYPIKGNADSGLYHTPGMPSYEQTIAEIWFATEDAAEAGGFRKVGS